MSTTAPTPPDLVATAVRALMLYSLAEFESGHARTIRITANGRSFAVADDGRGHSIDKTLEGTSYLKFIYQHFDCPFESGRAAPVQLQGIGMSFVNAVCSRLDLTVRKRDQTLRLCFRNGRLHREERTAVFSETTGTTISAEVDPRLQSLHVATGELEKWLLGLLVAHPSLTLIFNDLQLRAAARCDAESMMPGPRREPR